MLIKKKIIPVKDGKKIIKGLDKIKGQIKKGKFEFKEKFEDIHLNIEKKLFEIIGASAGYMHTARSRNDQVVTDFKLWVKESSFSIIKELDILGCNSILIEAGGTLAGSFFDKRLVDKVYAFISPSIFGGKKAPNAIEGEGIDKIKERINLKISSIEQLDEDILIIGRTH